MMSSIITIISSLASYEIVLKHFYSFVLIVFMIGLQSPLLVQITKIQSRSSNRRELWYLFFNLIS